MGDSFDENISRNFGRGGGPAGNSLQGQITVSTGNITVDFVLHKLVLSRRANSWDVRDRFSTSFKVKFSYFESINRLFEIMSIVLERIKNDESI